MSLFTRLRLPGIRRPRTRPGRTDPRLCLQPLEDRAVPSTVVEQLTDSVTEFVGAPTISADGNRVAFQSSLDLTGQNADGNAELFLYDATTGAFTQITNTTGPFLPATDPVISADGNWVVFTSTVNLTGQNADGNAEVFLYNAAGLTLAQVTNTTGGFSLANRTPTVSGDGSRIVFTSTRNLVPLVGNADGNTELFLYDVPTGTFTQVTNTTGGGFSSVVGPAISTDGNRVAFLSSRDLVPGGNTDLGLDYFLYDHGTGSVTQLTNITAVGGVFTPPKVDADGSRVTFSTTHDLTGANADLNQEVFLFDAGTGLTQVTNTAAGSSFASALSADGSRLALSSDADLTGQNADGNREVFLYGAADGTFTQVTDTVGADPAAVSSDLPVLSADGTRIALLSNADLTGSGSNADGSTELFLVTVNGVQPPTPAERIADLIADVEGLVQAGKLTAQQAAGLKDKLNVALKHLEMGRTDKAVHMLRVFIQQVQGFVDSGKLSAADGGALIADAQVVIDELT